MLASGLTPEQLRVVLLHELAHIRRFDLAINVLQRLVEAGIQLDGASDHGVSEALYLRDFDDNGVELYWDRPREQWPRNADGEIKMKTDPLNLRDLLGEIEKVAA